jgi:hypothetical protein
LAPPYHTAVGVARQVQPAHGSTPVVLHAVAPADTQHIRFRYRHSSFQQQLPYLCPRPSCGRCWLCCERIRVDAWLRKWRTRAGTAMSEGARPSRWQTAAPKAIARLDASRAAHGQPGLSRGHAANRLARRRLPQVQYIDSLHLAVSIFLAEALPQPPIASTSSPATASGVSPPFAGR